MFQIPPGSPYTAQQVSRIWRHMAFHAHPDRGGSADRYIRLAACRDVLLMWLDPVQRLHCKFQCHICQKQTDAFNDCKACQGKVRDLHTCGLEKLSYAVNFYKSLRTLDEKRTYRSTLAHTKNPQMARNDTEQVRADAQKDQAAKEKAQKKAEQDRLREAAAAGPPPWGHIES